MSSGSSSSDTSAAVIEAERFQYFIACVADYAICLLSPAGIITSWNSGAERFLGYTASEIIGQHCSCFYTDEDQASGVPEAALRTAFESEKFEDEGWRIRKGGSRFWATVVIDSIRDTEGTLIGFAMITRDITERKKAAAELYQHEEQFRLLVDSVTDYAIYMLSPSGEISNWNAGAKRIKGYEQDEVIGTHFSRFYTEEDRAAGIPVKALETAALEGRFVSEGWRIRKDGSRFWAHALIHPIYNEAGKLIGFAKITRDITERREAEQALENAQQALFHAQKMEAIGKLTGGVAHDFNNLLSVIVNGLAVLRMIVRDDQAVKMLDSMERAANRGSTLTQQLLTFARRQPFKQDKHNLNRIIKSFEAVLRRANRSSAQFDVSLAASLPSVMVDSSQFEAALLNLVVNARDAIPEGGAIAITTEAVDLGHHQVKQLPAGRYVKVSIIDNGHGMEPEIITYVIEPFYTTKPVGKGTGLGLSQVYGLIQESGGEMMIESTPGVGTCVSLYFPALVGDASMPGVEAEGHDKALIVDDQPDVLDMAVELFRSLGYEVFAANSGEEALEIIKRTPDIHLLFSDVVMPGMSGIDLGERVRFINPEIKVILASGYAEPALKTDNAALGEFQFIAKPYTISEIIKKLRLAG